MDQAIALFQQLVELQPNDANHRYNLACGLARAGRADEAMEQLTQALALDSKMKELAMTDTDLLSLHERADFKALVGPATLQP
jgi:tetratricopeptide (TPR) repeat protein